MKFKDRLVRCGACGAEFVYTVPEQRRRAARGQAIEAPAFCKACRAADVRLAEAADDVEPDRVTTVEAQPVVASADVALDAEQTKQDQPKDQKQATKQHKGESSGGSRRGGGGKSRGRTRQGGASSGRRSRPRQTEIRVRHFGTVKWFDETRGFGFIAQDNGDELFVHSSGILTAGRPALEQGESVEYEVEHTDRGLQAVDVVPLS